MTSRPYFNRNETAIIKGISLILMFIHHFFTFPSWWGEGISYPLIERFAQYFNDPFRICVPVFCFLTGYFYACNSKRSLGYSLRKITDILITYWAVLIPFALIAVFFASYSYTFPQLVKEFFAISNTTMTFCWYVSFYIAAMLLLPAVARLLDRSAVCGVIFAFVVTPFCLRALNTAVPGEELQGILMELATFAPTLMSGYLFARYGWFEKGLDKLGKFEGRPLPLKAVFWLGMAAVAAMCRWAVPSLHLTIDELPLLHTKPVVYLNLDVIYAPVFIWCVVNLNRHIHSAFTDRVFVQIGKYSLLMWFASCIFFNNSREVFQPLLYLPRNPLLVLVWGCILCYGFARLVDYPVKRILRIKNYYVFKGSSGGERESL